MRPSTSPRGRRRRRAGGEDRPDRWQVRFSDGQQRAAEGAPGHWELARSLARERRPGPRRGRYGPPLVHRHVCPRPVLRETHAPRGTRPSSCSPTTRTCCSWPAASTRRSRRRRSRAWRARSRCRAPGTGSAPRSRSCGRPRSCSGARWRRIRRSSRHGSGWAVFSTCRANPSRRRWSCARRLPTLLSDDGSTTPPDATLMLYFAEMFFGAAAEELGQLDRARASYARAAELYPGAPSPQLALSQLALRGNDRAAALDAVQRAVRRRQASAIVSIPGGAITTSRAVMPPPGSTGSTGRSPTRHESVPGPRLWRFSSPRAADGRAGDSDLLDRRRGDPPRRPRRQSRPRRARTWKRRTSRSETMASCRT